MTPLDFRLSFHFKLSEFLLSDSRPDILNEENVRYFLNDAPRDYLRRLCRMASRLETIRSSYKKPIYLTSGYRCPHVNKMVGGVPKSFHTQAMSCDVVYSSELKRCLNELVKAKKISFGEFLSYPKRGYIHLTFNNL